MTRCVITGGLRRCGRDSRSVIYESKLPPAHPPAPCNPPVLMHRALRGSVGDGGLQIFLTIKSIWQYEISYFIGRVGGRDDDSLLQCTEQDRNGTE